MQQQLRIVRTRHAFGFTLDALDDQQKLRLVLGQPLLEDFDFLNLLLEATEQLFVPPTTRIHRHQLADFFQ
ncbi:hypothetical protein D9M73_193010 [compost metagenome]